MSMVKEYVKTKQTDSKNKWWCFGMKNDLANQMIALIFNNVSH